MGKVVLDMSVSLDGIGAGPNPSAENPMGAGGERLHAWMPFYDPEQESTAGVPAASEADARMVRELFAAAKGAVVLGKRTFDLGLEPWGGTPFPAPCFVLTHEARDDLVTATGTFAFVTDGIEQAVRGAQAAAGDKDVLVMGGLMLPSRPCGPGSSTRSPSMWCRCCSGPDRGCSTISERSTSNWTRQRWWHPLP